MPKSRKERNKCCSSDRKLQSRSPKNDTTSEPFKPSLHYLTVNQTQTSPGRFQDRCQRDRQLEPYYSYLDLRDRVYSPSLFEIINISRLLMTTLNLDLIDRLKSSESGAFKSVLQTNILKMSKIAQPVLNSYFREGMRLQPLKQSQTSRNNQFYTSRKTCKVLPGIQAQKALLHSSQQRNRSQNPEINSSRNVAKSNSDNETSHNNSTVVLQSSKEIPTYNDLLQNSQQSLLTGVQTTSNQTSYRKINLPDQQPAYGPPATDFTARQPLDQKLNPNAKRQASYYARVNAASINKLGNNIKIVSQSFELPLSINSSRISPEAAGQKTNYN